MLDEEGHKAGRRRKRRLTEASAQKLASLLQLDQGSQQQSLSCGLSKPMSAQQNQGYTHPKSGKWEIVVKGENLY